MYIVISLYYAAMAQGNKLTVLGLISCENKFRGHCFCDCQSGTSPGQTACGDKKYQAIINHHPKIISQSSVNHQSVIMRHSSFIIRHSSFVIYHSSFIIRHSPFTIYHSSFIVHNRLSPTIRHRSFFLHV